MKLSNMIVFKFCRLLHQTSTRLGQKNNMKTKSAKDVIKSLSSTERPNFSQKIEDKSKPTWQKQELALKRKFEGRKWNPPKKLSREEMESLRLLRRQFPQLNASDLAARFKISPEAVRRVLKSKWQPTEQEAVVLNERWKRRGERIKNMYDSDADNLFHKEKVPLPKKISISSARNSTGFVLRRSKAPAREKRSSSDLHDRMPKKNKLFLLKSLHNSVE